LIALVVASCAHGGGGKSGASAPTVYTTRPVPKLALHWNNAADTTRTLRWPSDKPFQTDLTITGLVDSVAGYELHLRLEPTTPNKGTAWKFANSGDCLAAVWAATPENDPFARAPWPHKLAITDARPMDDGSVALFVSVTFDMIALHPDSTYSLCHMFFQPPQAASSGGHCAGWDAPVRIYVESATLLFTQNLEQPVLDVGKDIRFEPQAQ
jgi:hypothetical protein